MKRMGLIFLAGSLTLSAMSCSSYSLLGKSSVVGRPAGWSENSHGKDTLPDYARVFPQDQVKKMEITLSAADWKLMQENMTQLFGDPSSQTGPGGMRTPGNFQPPDGFQPPVFPGAPGATPAPSVSPAPGSSTSPSARPTPPAGAFPGAPPGGGGGPMLENGEDPIYRPCTVKVDGVSWNYVGIRYKGNSSLRSSWGRSLKMPFRIDMDEFESEHPEIKNQRMYGFKRLTFSSGFSDNSLIREKVTADIFLKAGIPSAQTAFYRIYVDYGEGQKYFGLYTMVEAPDAPMLATQFKNPSGNLYKPSGNGAKLATFDQASFPKKTNETTSDWKDIQALFAALNADRSDPARWRAGLEQVLDVEGFLNWLAVNTLIQNWDTYGRMARNYYLYNDPTDQRLHWIPWDNNMALASSMGGPGGAFPGLPRPGATPTPSPESSPSPRSSSSPVSTPSAQPTPPANFQRPGGPGGGAPSLELSKDEINASWPLIRFLIDDPVYHARYTYYLAKALETAFAPAPTRMLYQQAHSLIRPYVVGSEGEQSDATMLSSPEAFESALDTLNTHLEERHKAAQEFLTKYAAELKMP